MNAEDNTSSKKKADNASNDNHTAVLDKIDAKKIDKGESESKPRIVLTFRSEKNSTKNSNMKIVSTEEKTEEVPRRSNRTRGKWEWICDSDTSPKKDKSGTQTTSENDESDSSHTNLKRSTRRRSKDCDNVLANAIARKEKSYETQPTPQRLSRRIKPTAKILANEELRIGLESQNIARLGIQTDKSPGEGVRTRRSARPIVVEEKKSPEHHLIEDEVVEIATTDDDSQSQNNVMKLKHLCELGLKAISPEEGDDSGNDNRDEEDEENETEDDDAEEVEAEEIVDEEDDIDDDPNVISKLLETDEEDSDDEFLCTIDVKKKRPRTRRSTRLTSSYDMNDSDEYTPVVEEEHKSPRRSTKRSSRLSYGDESTKSFRSKRRRHRSVSNYEGQSDAEIDETSNPAEGEEVAEAVCPVEESTTFATCFCETFSNIYAASEELTEPVFCQAIEMVDGIRVGCSHPARRERTRTGKRTSESLAPMIRAGPRAPYILACSLHAAQFAKHMCCPGCGLFCTQGIFYQCSLGHLFHLDCGLPYNDVKVTQPGCPHCGVYSYTHMGNMQCFKVQIEMKCSNKRIFLPDQREQCTPAYLSFTTQDTKIDQGPIIPKELLPSPPIELKQLGQAPNKSPTQLCDAIMKGETVDQLLPKIVSSSHINKPLASQSGGTCLHAAAKTGHTAALYLLHYAGANLNATDNHTRTPLMLAIITLLEKPENLVKEAAIDKKANDREDMEIAVEKKSAVSVKTKDDETDTEDIKIKREEDIIETEDCKKEITDDNLERENKTEIVNDISSKPKEEDLIKVIRYLLAAGCDINFQGPDGMTALHICAQLGGARVASLLLSYSNTLVDVKDQGGWTPLVWAAENDYTDVVKVLLEAGADALTTDSESNGVAHWCALSGAAQSLSLLLHDAPQAADMHNAHADTPLHIAARQGHYACVVILLARGARTDVENAAGELPVEVCTEQCQSAISLNMQMTIAVRDKVSRYKLLSSDISNGREPYPIPCVNEVDDAPLPEDFTYVTRHVTPQPINIDTSIDTMQGCDCKDGDCSSSDCSCCTLGVRCWYTRGRLNASFPYHDPPMLFECNQTCGCNLRRCNNSVVTSSTASSSVCVRTQVFRAGGARGWGLRARQKVLRGEPVALYCGELLRLELADTRAADHYMFALDVKPDLLEQCADKTQLCVDATQYGSAARFINHSCRPNLAPVRVFTSTRDLRLPAVMLFAIADINPDEELTFDYGDKFWSIKSKWVKCECGAVDCRYPSKSDEIE